MAPADLLLTLAQLHNLRALAEFIIRSNADTSDTDYLATLTEATVTHATLMTPADFYNQAMAATLSMDR
jgi:hypothetical protein